MPHLKRQIQIKVKWLFAEAPVSIDPTCFKKKMVWDPTNVQQNVLDNH